MSRYRPATSWGSELDIQTNLPNGSFVHIAGTPRCEVGAEPGAYACPMSGEEPLVRVVRGIPTAEELAALVGAILVRRPAATAPEPAVSAWARSGRPGALDRTGIDGWRTSGLPR